MVSRLGSQANSVLCLLLVAIEQKIGFKHPRRNHFFYYPEARRMKKIKNIEPQCLFLKSGLFPPRNDLIYSHRRNKIQPGLTESAW